MRLLNRLGVCASPETHARYLQYRVQKRKDEGPMVGYPTDSFTFFSVDNLDFIHSYARVFSGKQQSSLHVTTIQVAQPKPCTLTNNDSSGFEVPVGVEVGEKSQTNKRLYSTRSPLKTNFSPLPKKQRRRRTGVEGTSDATDQLCHSDIQASTLLVTPPTLGIDFKLKGKRLSRNYVRSVTTTFY